MFHSAFGFRGRLNRLQYLLSVLILAALVVAISVMAVFTVFFQPQAHAGTSMRAVLIGAFGLVPAMMWSSFSLQARRFRDMGWSPLFVIPTWIVFGILDRLGALAAPFLAFGHSHQTWIGLFVNLALVGCLLFWPSAEDADIAAPPGKSARADDPVVFAPVSAPWNSAPSRAGFGRRGL